MGKEAYKDIWVFAEQEGGVDSPVIPPDFAQVVRMIAAALAVPAKERG